MFNNKKNKSVNRSYPPFWEKFVPVALAVIVVIIAILLIVILIVALGVYP